MIDHKPMDCPMHPNKKLMAEQAEVFSDLKRYRRLVGKLIYLTIMCFLVCHVFYTCVMKKID